MDVWAASVLFRDCSLVVKGVSHILFVVCASGLNVCLSSVRASVLTYGPEELPMFFWGS